jgi:hypothetical protein
LHHFVRGWTFPVIPKQETTIMAVSDLRLSTTRYVVPGTYIGPIFQPQAGTPTGTPRYPCIVGKGHRLAREDGVKHIRSRVYSELLSFSTTAPYIAILDHNANPDDTLAQLRKSSGEVILSDKWHFLTSLTSTTLYNRVQVDTTTFDSTATYYIEYQSVDRDVLDQMEFDDVREMLLVGDAQGQNLYQEFVDYRVVTDLIGGTTHPDSLVAATGNAFPAGSCSTVVINPAPPGVATVAFAASSAYTHQYTRQYRLTVATAPDATHATFTLEVTNISGGNHQVPPVPQAATVAAPITRTIESGVNDTSWQVALGANYDPTAAPAEPAAIALPNYFTDDGLVLDFAFLAGGYTPGTTYTWTAYGAGLMEFSSAHDNDNQYSEVSDPVELGIYNKNIATGQTSGGYITIHSDTDYTGEFDRSYFLNCTAGAGNYPTRTATVRWSTYNELPVTSGTLALNEAAPATYTRVLLENGIYLTFTWGTDHLIVDTTNTIVAADATTLSSAVTLANALRTGYTAHDANGGGVYHIAAAVSNHAIAAVAASDLATLRTLALDIQTKYAAHLSDVVDYDPAGTFAFLHGGTAATADPDTYWISAYTITATSTLAEVIAFLNDVKLKYNRHRQARGFDITNTWRVDAKAPRREFTAKDDRTVTITVNTVVAATSITSTYVSSTIEGGWATVTLTDYSDPWYDLPNGIRVMVRNIPSATAWSATVEQFAANDVFTFTTVCRDQIDWSLTSRASETIAEADILLDTLGNITGTPLYYWLDLQNTPTSVMRVKRADTGAAISYLWISDTPYIAFTTDPATDVVVDYEYRGFEPDPGNSYFVTANRLRLAAEYETPRRFLNPDESRAGLYPATTDNHVWMASEIMWNAAPFGIYVVQVKDLSGNGNFTLADYKRGIDATETSSEISDVIPLSYFGVIPYAKVSCERMNDPFSLKERLLWVGANIGTAIGDESTPDTLVYYARRTLQCSPNSYGKGNIILLGNTTPVRTFVLEDGSTTAVTLDGSYLAAYAAADLASFTNPTSTLLHRTVAAFDSMDTPNEKEAVLLGTASILWLQSLGTGSYQYAESHTVDTTEKSLNEISARATAHFVVRWIRSQMNAAMIALVPPSPYAGLALLAGYLTQLLGSLVSSQITAPYGSETNPPTIRDVASSDYQVLIDEHDRTLYHFKFFYNQKYPIKRLFGLYSVDTKFWAAAAAA